MRLVQSVRSGDLRLVDSSAPTPGPTQVLVGTRASLISAGTERSSRSLASKSLVAKARARPDLVRQVIDRARSTGIRSTVGAVRSRLSEDMPLGYSAAGEIVAVGEAVADLRPGQRVSTAGAPHADLQLVAGNLVARMPDGVSFEDAAFATVGSIALNGIRLAEIGPGARIVVVGLGLVGQLTARLASAAGALVAGVEPEEWKRGIAEGAGVATFPADASGWEAVRSWTGGTGADAVLVTAATKSSEPLASAAGAAMDRGIIVVVGDVGMDLDRRPFYDGELTLRVSRSYGPGRYDPGYEELGIDYPSGHVRWTAQRNMAAFLDLVADGRVSVTDLTTHRYPFSDAPAAYEMLEAGEEQYIGIVLDYDQGPETTQTAGPAKVESRPSSVLGAGLIGAGRFAERILVPTGTRAGFVWNQVSSGSGASAQRLADRVAGLDVAADAAAIIDGDNNPVVFVTTRHDTHAGYTAQALQAGKHVFCEKPLALSEAELYDITDAWTASSGSLMVGFNRRWSPAIADAARIVDRDGPLQVMYRINAGPVEEGHWLLDRRMGGRLLGEGCHFVDTCSAIVSEDVASVTVLTSGQGELLLDQNFTLLLGYPGGSQATVTYASQSSTRAGKERIEILGRGASVTIDDFHRLDSNGPGGHTIERYKPADKGHDRELEVFAEIVRGDRDGREVALSAFRTTQVMFAAVESAMTGTAVAPKY